MTNKQIEELIQEKYLKIQTRIDYIEKLRQEEAQNKTNHWGYEVSQYDECGKEFQ